jgi:allantoate deiminase
MNIRRDPVIPAARIIHYIEEETRKYPNAVATIGKISVNPGGINVIPNQIEFTYLRDIDETVRDKIEQNIVSYARQICNEREIELTVSTLQRISPAPCSQEICQVIERACEKIGLNAFTLPSGAGHDGMQLKDLCPIGMIFVQSRDGVSHTPDEWSSQEDCGIGTEVLYHTVLQLAE